MLQTRSFGNLKQNLARKKEDDNRQRAVHSQQDRGIVKKVDDLVDQALAMRATDIHFEVVEDGPRVRARQDDGALVELNRPDPQDYPNVINRLKVLTSMDITNAKTPQRGFYRKELDSGLVEFEAYSFPAVQGEKLVLKVRQKRNIEVNLDDLGMEQTVLTQYKHCLDRGQGLVLVAGPPGSGKNTTLYSSLHYLASTAKNICTCESIIKYNLAGAVQGRYDERAEYTYEEMLRALVQQEPDLLLVGEIKTPDTARIVVQSAIARRLVFGRIVASDTLNAIQSLLDMGLQSFIVASALHCVVSQRLVRKLCAACRERYSPSEAMIKEIGIPLKGNIQFYRHVGCPQCGDTGFKGHTALFECFVPTDATREMIVARETPQRWKQKAIELGMLTLKKDGIKKAFLGTTTIEEVLNSL